jgi:hypothetical protein
MRIKKVFGKLAAAVFVFGIFACCVSCDKEVGNGKLITTEKTVSAFEKINCEDLGSANVRYYFSEEYRALVTFDENLQEYTEVFTTNNTLNIRLKAKNSYRYQKLSIEIYCPILTGVTVSHSVSFESVNKIIAPTFDANVSGSGKIKGEIECENFTSKISDAGKMTVVGTSTNANIDISDSGNFNGKDFCIKNADISVRGSGEANVWVTNNLKATVSGAGKLNYWGEPKVDQNISDSGKIKKM